MMMMMMMVMMVMMMMMVMVMMVMLGSVLQKEMTCKSNTCVRFKIDCFSITDRLLSVIVLINSPSRSLIPLTD